MNRVFKTVWNKLRGCYVAVNEAVTGTAQSRGEGGHAANQERRTPRALKLTAVAGMVGIALALNAGLAGAEEIKTSQTISDAQNYDSLTISGTAITKTLPAYKTKYYGGKDFSGMSESDVWGDCTKHMRSSYTNCPQFVTNTAKELANKNSDIDKAVVTISPTGSFKLTGDLLLTSGVGTFTATISYRGAGKSGYPNCHDNGNCYYFADVTTTTTVQSNYYAELVNAGGVISVSTLDFENAANKFTQTAGTTSLEGFSGGGQVNLSSGLFNISNLDSGAKVTSTGGTISADTINLTSKSLSMTDTKLSTGLNQVADFKQAITQAQGLLMDGEDTAKSLNASILGRTEQVNAVLAKFKNNVTWSGGAFHFTGSYTKSVADTAKQVIQAAYGTNVSVTFEKVVDDPTPADVVNGFTAAVANAIMAENNVGVGTIFRYYQADARLNALLVTKAKGDNNINSSVGFKSINGSQTVTVTDGLELALLGNGAVSTVADGTVVADNGTLRLGSTNTAVNVGGKLATVTLKNVGLLKSQRGDFTVSSLTGDGSLEVASGSLTLGNFDITKGITNNGNLTLSQNQVFLHGGVNTGTLTTKAAEMSGTFSNDKGTWNLNGGLTFEYGAKVANGTGTINTAFANLYDNGLAATQDGVRTISLTATSPEAVKETLTDLFTKYVPGSLKETVVEHMTFDGTGKVVITDANLTKTQRDDLTAAFKKAFGDKTQLVFSDVSNDQQVQASVLNTAKVNQLHDAKLGLESVIYVDRDLQGEGVAVVIGDAGVKNSTGFAGIADAKTLEVADGKNLVLIGGKAGAAVTPYQMTGVLAQIGAGSTLTLGSLGLADAYSGTTADIHLTGGAATAQRANLKVAAGNYTTGAITAQQGTVTVDKGATLNSGALSFVNAGELVNRGTTVINGTLSGAGTANQLAVSNYGDLTINGTASVIGTFTNNAQAQAHLADVNVIGTLTNAQNAFLEANKVSVLGQLANFGRIEASDNSEVFGTLNNSGVIELYNTTVGNRGALNNTYTLNHTGLATVSGLLSNAAGAQAHLQTLVLDGKDARLTNTGTMTIDSLTLKNGAHAVNGQLPTADGIALFAARAARGKQVIDTYNVQAGTTAANAGDGFYGTGTIDGTFTTAATGTTVFGGSSELPKAKGYTVSATGKVVNAGSTTFGGSLTNAGSITGAGTLVFAKADGALNTFNNAGTIQAGTLAADGITYSQTAGRLTADNNWFTNSTVNLTGGTITHDTLGKGNTYNLGRDGNTKGDALFTLSRLTGDSIVNIRQGSTLHADSIALSGDKTTHLLGGVLGTTLDQIFDSVSYDAHDIDAKDPDDKVQISGTMIATGVGNVLTSVARGIEFNWGTVAFDDASYSVALAADALNKLDAVDEASAGKLEVAFNGKADQTFGVDLANKVVATKDGSTAYATFVNETLTNTSAGNPDADTLVVGSTDRAALFVPTAGTPNVLQNSMGFKNVTGVTGGLWINSGKHFVLVGDANGLDLADGTVVVGGVNDNAVHSLLTLGSYATTAPTKGHLKEVYVGVLPSVADQGGKTGTLQVRHGDFTIETLHNGSLLQVGGDGKTLAEDRTTSLTVTNLDMVSASEVQNDAVLNVTNLTSHTGTGNHVVHNNEKATMTVAAGDLNGQLVNAGSFKGTDLTLRMVGSENSATGTMNVTNLTVFGDSTWGTGATARGGLINAGTITTTALKVAGDFDNESVFTTDTLALTGSGTVTNKKSGTADSLALAAGTTLTNAKEGTLTVNGTKVASTVSGALDNAGTLAVAGDRDFTLATNGTLTNSGSYKGHLTINGGAYSNTGTSVFDGLTITAGSLTNTSGSVTDTGTTSITMANKTDVAIANQDGATLGFADLQLNKGTIAGGVIGTADTVATVGQQGVMQDAAGVFKTLTNAGSLTFTDAAVSGKFTNTGALVSTGTATLSDLDNQAAGRLTLASGSVTGANAGTITAAGALTAAGSNSGTVMVDNQGSFTVEAGKSYDNTKTLTVNGAANVDGTLSTSGTFTAGDTTTVGAAGTVTSSGTTNFGDLALQSGAHFNLNGGTTAVKNLAQADGVTYTQTAGTFAAQKGWFTNSTLNIAGGKLDAASIKDAEGNPLGSLGVNIVNISGANPTPAIKDDASADEKSHYKDNLTVVTANTVTSDTTVNINAGGVLDVDALDLTEKGKFTLAGGVLQTSLDQIFGWVKTIAVDINAKDPETGTVEVPTKVLASTTVGDVKDSMKTNAALESGTIAFDDAYFSASTIVSSSNRFAAAFGDTSKVALHFLGTMESPFNVDTAKQLADEGTAQVLAGIVLDTTTLHNETRADGKTNTKLVIGDTDETGANRIGISMGFQNVANADFVTVNDGKQFVLVGTQKAEGFDWTKDLAAGQNQLLLDAADGGSVAVNNGVFTFGSDGVANPTVGWIDSSTIGKDGSVVAKNGEFADWTIANSGTLQVNGNAILHTNSYTGEGTGKNAGTFDVNGTFEVGAGGFTNAGTLDAADTATTKVTGTLTNEKTGTAKYDDMLIAQGGSSVNAGTESGDLLHLENGATHTNTGTSVWNGVTIDQGGSLVNGTVLAAGDKKGDQEGFTPTGTLVLGSDAENETVALNGDLTNHGVLDASKSENTVVAGHLVNDGKAQYQDMTVAKGGSSVNDGYEKGKNLTVADGGSHINTGTSIWENAQVDQDGSLTNGTDSGVKGDAKDFTSDDVLQLGTKDGAETVVVGGTLTNNGVLDASKAETTQVAGSVTNNGQAKYHDMTVAQGGQSVNDGFEQGRILTVQNGGTHTNTGTSIWENAAVDQGGSLTNGTDTGKKGDDKDFASSDHLTLGTDKHGETVTVGGTLTNNGILDASKAETTQVAGTVTNNGQAKYHDMTVAPGGRSDNSGLEQGKNLTVQGTHTNTGTSIWENVTTDKDGKLDNKGDLTTDHLTVNGGTIMAGKGSVTAKDTDLNGGSLVVGNIDEVKDANKVSVNLAGAEKTGTDIWVIGNGDLSFGAGADKLAAALQAPGFSSEHASRVTVGETVHVGTGTIAAGAGVWKSEGEKLSLNDGDLFFGKDSYTLVDIGTLGDKNPAFTTDSAGAKVTVEKGAVLVLGNIKANGDYVITEGFATAGNETDGTWSGGWTGDNLYALPLSNTGIGWDLSFHHAADKSWVHASLQDVRTVYPDIIIPGNTNDSLNNGKKENGGADKFIHDTLSDPHLSKDDKTRQINSVANMSAASGALETAFGDLGQTTDAVEDHLSFQGEHFTQAGYLARGAKGSALWVNVLGGWKKSTSLGADGSMEGGHKNDSYGFVLGADYVPQAGKTTFGAALAYTDGSVKSSGDWLSTSTETKSYSLTGYGSWTPNEKVNVSGSVTVQKGSADATQTMLGGGFREAAASIDTTLVSAAFRAEYRKDVGPAVLIPHAGIRAVYAKTSGYDTKVDGDKVFSNSVDNATQVQFPVGVAIRGEFETRKGWKIRPTGDVTFTAIAGDTEQTTTVAGSRGVTDAVTGEFSGRFVTSLNLGLQAEKGGTMIGIGLGVNKGDGGRQDTNVKVQLRHAF